MGLKSMISTIVTIGISFSAYAADEKVTCVVTPFTLTNGISQSVVLTSTTTQTPLEETLVVLHKMDIETKSLAEKHGVDATDLIMRLNLNFNNRKGLRTLMVRDLDQPYGFNTVLYIETNGTEFSGAFTKTATNVGVKCKVLN